MTISSHTSHSQPIITSLLDTDAYKLHMQQAVFHQYPDVEVVAEFHCRKPKKIYAHISMKCCSKIDHLCATALSARRTRLPGATPLL